MQQVFNLLDSWLLQSSKNIPQILAAGVQLIAGLGQAMLEAIPNALKGVWDGIKNGFSSLWDTITGKSSSSKEKNQS